jgi:hypothetical protein
MKRAAAVITFGTPRPFLEPGTYLAECTGADWAWSRRWKKTLAQFKFGVPIDYTGRSYVGDLCAFVGLGTKQDAPYAPTGGKFYAVWCDANGDGPTAPTLSKENLRELFVGRLFEIGVETVKKAPRPDYSVVRTFRVATENTRTREHANTPTREHPNLPTRQHSNNLTLKETQQHLDTSTPSPQDRTRPVESEDSSLGSSYLQHTHYPGEGAVAIAPVPFPSCFVHGNDTSWWHRADGSRVCGRCTPNPAEVSIQ